MSERHAGRRAGTGAAGAPRTSRFFRGRWKLKLRLSPGRPFPPTGSLAPEPGNQASPERWRLANWVLVHEDSGELIL